MEYNNFENIKKILNEKILNSESLQDYSKEQEISSQLAPAVSDVEAGIPDNSQSTLINPETQEHYIQQAQLFEQQSITSTSPFENLAKNIDDDNILDKLNISKTSESTSLSSWDLIRQGKIKFDNYNRKILAKLDDGVYYFKLISDYRKKTVHWSSEEGRFVPCAGEECHYCLRLGLQKIDKYYVTALFNNQKVDLEFNAYLFRKLVDEIQNTGLLPASDDVLMKLEVSSNPNNKFKIFKISLCKK